jgi:hypothetical protein
MKILIVFSKAISSLGSLIQQESLSATSLSGTSDKFSAAESAFQTVFIGQF